LIGALLFAKAHDLLRLREGLGSDERRERVVVANPHIRRISYAFLLEFIGGAIEYDASGVFLIDKDLPDRDAAPAAPSDRAYLIGIKFGGDFARAFSFGYKGAEHPPHRRDLY